MNRLEVVPQIYTVLPNNGFEFKARADVNTPALWGSISNGTVTATNGLTNVSPGTVAGAGQHALMSGIGSIEWTINDQQRPTGGGALIYTGYFNGTAIAYQITIAATQIVIRDEANNVLTTISYSVISGDVFRLDLANGFRLYRSSTLLHERVSGLGNIGYPATYRVDLAATVAASPQTIAAPKLYGDWKLRPDAAVVWTTPSHGSISTTSGIRTEYSGGTIPGQYSLLAWISQSADTFALQQNRAIIVIPPLILLGPNEITLEPGQKVRPKTNYDPEQGAQTGLVAWSVVSGGGSFSQGEFTAPTLPGTSVLRATCSANGNIVDLSVTVPAVITNANSYTAAKVSEQIDFDTNIPLMPWFIGLGAMAEGQGNVGPGLPPDLREKDIMLLPAESANQSVPTPSGWTEFTTSPQGIGTGGDPAATRLTMFWKRAGVSESAPTVTDSGDHTIGQILSYRGVIDSGNPWDATPVGDTAASSTSVSIPGTTTVTANCRVVAAVAQGTDTATPQVSGYANADLTNLTERTDISTTQGNGGGFAVVDGEKAAAGAYGATTATLATASVQGRMSFPLKPAPVTWSASIGSINSSSGLWTAPSQSGQTAIITVTNGALTKRIYVDVLEAFPRTDFILPWPIDFGKRVLVSEAEDGSRTSRVKVAAKRSFSVNLLVDTTADLGGVAGLDTIRAFWDRHYPGKKFILDDPEAGVRLVVYADSDLRWEYTSAGINIAFRVKE